jgi:hypothetical protein
MFYTILVLIVNADRGRKVNLGAAVRSDQRQQDWRRR